MWQGNLGLMDKQYQICVTILYVLFIFSEMPSNLILVLAGSYQLFSQYGVLSPTFKVESRFIQEIYLCLILTNTVTNFSELLTACFFIGIVEGPMLPSISKTLNLKAEFAFQLKAYVNT